MDQADGGIRALDAGLDQREVLGVAEPELVEPIGLGPADVARGGPARRIRILVMTDEGLPVFVSRLLHGGSDLRPGKGHQRGGYAPGRWPARRRRSDQRNEIRSAPWTLRWSSAEPLASRTPMRSTRAA